MRTALEIKKQIQEESEILDKLYTRIHFYEKDIESLKRKYKKAEERERNCFVDEWLKATFGIQDQKEARDGRYIVFDKDARFIKTVACGHGEEFHRVGPSSEKGTLEHWLKKNKLYAHCASSFCDRSREWYDMSFKEQLESLSWEFNGGRIVKTQW